MCKKRTLLLLASVAGYLLFLALLVLLFNENYELLSENFGWIILSAFIAFWVQTLQKTS